MCDMATLLLTFELLMKHLNQSTFVTWVHSDSVHQTFITSLGVVMSESLQMNIHYFIIHYFTYFYYKSFDFFFTFHLGHPVNFLELCM